MIETTKTLVEDMHAAVGYTQSDEISLLFYADAAVPTSCFPFDGRYLKIATICAALASAKFARLTLVVLPEKDHIVPHFDGRAWSVPSPQDAVDAFVWRMQDASKNSVSMAAQAYYSHRQLLNKSTLDKVAMLWAKGIVWSEYPDFFRVGCFLRRRSVERVLTTDELIAIPEKYRPSPGATVVRSEVVKDTPPPVLTWDWLLRGEEVSLS
jgi:tRNA(His) 5'-end guanylyltransferase